MKVKQRVQLQGIYKRRYDGRKGVISHAWKTSTGHFHYQVKLKGGKVLYSLHANQLVKLNRNWEPRKRKARK